MEAGRKGVKLERALKVRRRQESEEKIGGTKQTFLQRSACSSAGALNLDTHGHGAFRPVATSLFFFYFFKKGIT